MAKVPGMDFGFLMKHAEKMQREMERVRQDLKERIVEGSAGGGVVRVLVNGEQHVVAVKIDREAVDPDDVGMLEDMIAAAANQAMKKSQELAQQEMAKATGGLNLPGLSGLLGT